ncbi:MAG: 1-acyl-sn-glycerol-3-phosphate acyltransferase [Candidatus Saccharibacteria bacterium]|nr:1-acyl-sn-glycerol-3-phosphate acyltransferase [Candidatus Saccharibacteria bacterium]
MAKRAQLYEDDLPPEERIFYYENETDDPIKTAGQEKGEERKLPENYQYIPSNPFVKLYSALLYRGFKLFARHYAKSYLELTIVGREKFKKVKGGYVIYGNHTNSYHDAFSPALIANRRIFTIINPVALDIPGVGKHLPYIGAMPLGTSPELKKSFHTAIDKRLAQGNCLVIYPEAHLWPYYTGIRKFPAGDRSFTYPVRNNLPIFIMTTTYQKSHRKNQVRPRLTVYVDGPFYPDPKKSETENRAHLAKLAYDTMKSHSSKNTYEYIKYIKKDHKK